MVVVTVAAILFSIAAPNFGEFVRDVRLRTANEDIFAAINIARTEALKRGEAVMLCRTGNPGAPLDTLACGANEKDGTANQSRDWTPGWILYAKPGYSGSGGAAYNRATDGDPILVGMSNPAGVEIKANESGNAYVAFFGDGSLNKTDGVLFAVCDERGVEEGSSIIIALNGRPYVSNILSDCTP